MFADDLAFLKSIGAREAQNIQEAESFCDFVSDVKPESYLEIGVRHGWTLYLVSKVIPKARLFGIDLPGVFPWGDEGSDEILRKVAQATGAEITFADSHEESTAAKFGNIDFVFIDGDHKYDGVKRDWELYGPLVKQGHIAFHDIHARPKEDPAKLIEVPRLWKEIKEKYPNKEIGSNPGIGILTIEG